MMDITGILIKEKLEFHVSDTSVLEFYSSPESMGVFFSVVSLCAMKGFRVTISGQRSQYSVRLVARMYSPDAAAYFHFNKSPKVIEMMSILRTDPDASDALSWLTELEEFNGKLDD